MLDINRVLKEDRLLRALTGLNRQAFNELLEAFSVQLEQGSDRSFLKSHDSEPEEVVENPDCDKLHKIAIFYFVLLQMLSHL